MNAKSRFVTIRVGVCLRALSLHNIHFSFGYICGFIDVAAKYSDPDFVRGASIRRQREQELNRVRVELKDLAYKLNLNPMNYISEGKVHWISTLTFSYSSPYKLM